MSSKFNAATLVSILWTNATM